MASPKTDIFSRFVFNNIMAEAFKYESRFFRRRTRLFAIKPLSSVTYQFRQGDRKLNKLLFFHAHNG
jgi:hypothetical protein